MVRAMALISQTLAALTAKRQAKYYARVYRYPPGINYSPYN